MGIGRRAASGAIPPQLSNGLLRNSRPLVSPVTMRRRNPRRRCCYCYCRRGRRRRFKIVVTKIPAESAARYQKPMYNRSSIAVYENVFFLLFRSTALIHISQETFPTVVLAYFYYGWSAFVSERSALDFRPERKKWVPSIRKVGVGQDTFSCVWRYGATIQVGNTLQMTLARDNSC